MNLLLQHSRRALPRARCPIDGKASRQANMSRNRWVIARVSRGSTIQPSTPSSTFPGKLV
jgi:hypothetical protein